MLCLACSSKPEMLRASAQSSALRLDQALTGTQGSSCFGKARQSLNVERPQLYLPVHLCDILTRCRSPAADTHRVSRHSAQISSGYRRVWRRAASFGQAGSHGLADCCQTWLDQSSGTDGGKPGAGLLVVTALSDMESSSDSRRQNLWLSNLSVHYQRVFALESLSS